MKAQRFSMTKIGLAVAAPLFAAFFSIVVSSIAVIATKKSPIDAFSSMLEYGFRTGSLMEIVNIATPYYIAAIAIAVTFRAGLFNIGVEGQLRLGALFSCYIGAMFVLPPVLHVLVVFMIAMTFGGLWAAIAAYLKVRRGVNEVISTIMLNFIAIGIISYIIVRTPIGTETSLNIRGTAAIPESGMLRGIAFIDPGTPIYGFFFISIVIGIAYWFLLNRTRFGFDLRATGKSATAARTSGVQSNRMIVVTMLLSGAVAGLVGLPYLLGDTGSYTLQFPTDWGFTGIAIALLGRNNPLGIALGAILWAFLDISSGQLILEGVPREISTIMQGLIVIVVVISYEVVRRYQVKSEQTSVAKALEKQEASV